MSCSFLHAMEARVALWCGVKVPGWTGADCRNDKDSAFRTEHAKAAQVGTSSKFRIALKKNIVDSFPSSFKTHK